MSGTRLTFALIPCKTVVLSLSSISLSLIFLTASASAVSGTYRRFVGELEASNDLEAAGVVGRTDVPPRVGEPGGVVDCTKVNLLVLPLRSAYKRHTTSRSNALQFSHSSLQPIHDTLPVSDTNEPNWKPILPSLLQVLCTMRVPEIPSQIHSVQCVEVLWVC